MKKTLILGAVKGFDFEILWPFLTSLRKSGYKGAVVFFCSAISGKTHEKLRQCGVELVPFDVEFPYMDGTFSRHNIWSNNSRVKRLAIHSLRYLLAYCYLKEHGAQYDSVLLTDTRDVIFQKDPFDFFFGDTLCCFAESEGIVIAGTPNDTAGWIELGFGTEERIKLSQRPIICSGVSIGSAPRILEYLETFMNTLVERDVPAAMPSIDQAIHNYLIYENLLPAITVYRNNDGPVLTLGLEDKVFYANGVIKNSSGQVPHMVHQYDRHWNVAKRYYSVRFIIRYCFRNPRIVLSVYLRSYFPRFYAVGIRVRDALFGI